jgi:glycine/sarcosine N-methyltransferase
MHAIALAQRGFAPAGADLSAGMIERARANTASAGEKISFEVVGFGGQARAFALHPLFPFDALLCLGNSLPHLLSAEDLSAALADFAACLRPGGLLLVQNRNFDAVMAHRERWMEPQSHRQDQSEWVFLRFYDYDPDGLIAFNILTLQREGEGAWKQNVTTTRLRPLLQTELSAAIVAAGFEQPACYGDMRGASFDALNSGNLIVTAFKRLS